MTILESENKPKIKIPRNKLKNNQVRIAVHYDAIGLGVKKFGFGHSKLFIAIASRAGTTNPNNADWALYKSTGFGFVGGQMTSFRFTFTSPIYSKKQDGSSNIFPYIHSIDKATVKLWFKKNRKILYGTKLSGYFALTLKGGKSQVFRKQFTTNYRGAIFEAPVGKSVDVKETLTRVDSPRSETLPLIRAKKFAELLLNDKI